LIYDVDKEAGVIYANTEDVVFLIRVNGIIPDEVPGEFLDEVARLCELQLGLAVDKDGFHFIFDGAKLSDDQK
jgi:hypothetical protein